ncbi:phosphopantetheine binding protein [Tumebacillus sp. BK434]|uniref:condensation domain-containing protein n=1 Tax=Tumebacillus sp. BK434 TaxID=2512169 RepID=UPI00104DECED|nr:condensation domain-containing protein [Tumebacillus sp. BK434]TCP59151.1 phosphopantetheine binding protein [Tumebacillus sp. BK434]
MSDRLKRARLVERLVKGANTQQAKEELAGEMTFRSLVLDERGLVSRAKLLVMPIEQRVSAVQWLLGVRLADALRQPQLRADAEQSLYGYGLDSLAAAELKQWLDETFGVKMPLARLLEGPSLQELAAEAAAAITPGERRLAARSERYTDTEIPMSHGQRAMWRMQCNDPQSAAFQIARAAKVTSALNVPVLRDVVKDLVKMHPLLRASFVLRDGEPVAVLRPEPTITFVMQGAQSWSEERLLEEVRKEANRPFDVEKEPLLRLHVYQTGNEEYVLLFNVHRLVADFWSLGLLMFGLQHAYAAAVGDMGISFFSTGAEYADFVQEQAELITGAQGEKLSRYWVAKLGGEMPALNLPTDHPRRAERFAAGGAVPFRLSEELSAQLRKQTERLGVTMNTLLLAAFQVLVHRATGQEDIRIGSPVNLRNPLKYQGVFGPFDNTVVFRADLSGQPAFADFVQQVKATVIEGLEHQDYPFPLLMEKLAVESDSGIPSLFQAMFMSPKAQFPGLEALAGYALGEAGTLLQLIELELVALPVAQEAVQIDLALMIADTQTGLAGKFEYKRDLFNTETIERMAGQFVQLLASIAEDASRSVARLPM